MLYLTADHSPAPEFISAAGMLHPTAPLIERDDTARLAALGLYPHETAPGDAPLGYTDWVLSDGVYSRIPAGTETERAEALALAARSNMSCTPRQARLALLQAGLLEIAETWIATAPVATKIDWEFAEVIRRDFGAVTDGASALGLTDAQVDSLFELARGL